MKNLLLSVFVFIFISNSGAHNGNDVDLDNVNQSLLYSTYFDPGHKQKRGSQLGKDRSAIEAYLGFHPSISVKLNFYGAKHGTLTERGYVMMGMDFDTDLFTKFGFLLNPGKTNKNRSLGAPSLGWVKLWRYVMVRHAIELGFKGQFLDQEENETLNTNYSGLTFNYAMIFDGNFIFDKTAWYFFDHRTARRIRVKLDAGIFFNFNKFNQPQLGLLSNNNSTGTDFNEDVTDDDGNPVEMNTYPVISPFVSLSLGFAF